MDKGLKHNGEFVTINQHKIHIYRQGNMSSPKLVFMSGSGTVAPVYHFKILYEKLISKYRVIVIEKFGYGYSDIFEAPCDIDSLVSFQRRALAEVGEKGPFILLPHSMSGLEAIRWKQMYPDDVKAIIGLDMATPKTYKEEQVTIEVGRVLNATQDILWEEEFEASKEEALLYSHPCAEIINTLALRQKKYDGYYYNEAGVLIAFDTDLTKQKAGLVIRKDALDKFLDIKKLHLVWFVNAAKEIHGKTLMITKYTDWTGLLEYTGDIVQGEYYIIE